VSAMGKTKRTEITVETRRRVLVRRAVGQPSASSNREPALQLREETKSVKPRKTLLLLVTLCAAGSWKTTLAQGAPASILEIDVENAVQYVKDVSDPLKFGTDSSVTSANVPKGLWENVQIADIVAVNGQPAKGTFTERSQRLSLRPSPNPGESIAD